MAANMSGSGAPQQSSNRTYIIIGVVVVLLLFGPWMLQFYIDFTREMILRLPLIAR